MKAVFFDVQPKEKIFLKNNIPQEIDGIFINDSLNFETKICQNIKNADILCTFVTSMLDNKVLNNFPDLKFILTRSVGFSHIDLNYCKTHNIKIFNTPHYGDYTVAEYIFGLLLHTVRNIRHGEYGIKTNEIKMDEYTGVELFSKTLGVIGAGSIGKNVLDIAHGFKMNTLAFDIRPSGNYNFVSLDKVIQKSDIISINLPLNEKTRHLINRETISKMKDGVIIVNAARGEIIDTKALYEAVINNKIAYAALDVIECEEILCTDNKKCRGIEYLKNECLEKFYLNQRLLRLPNVTITPHIAYNTKEAVERILKITIENLNSCLNFNPDTGAKNLVLL